MQICFLDNTKFQYNYRDKYSPKLRGGETVLINLSSALAKMGHKITIFNNCYKNEIFDGIEWININQKDIPESKKTCDLAISNGDTSLFEKVKSNKKIFFSYSLQTIEKFIRKKQLYSYLKHRPKIVFLGNYHKNKTSKICSLFGHLRLNLAVDDLFINHRLDSVIDKEQSIFTSRADRNLDLLLDIWNENIFPNFKTGKLLVTKPAKKINQKNNIIIRELDTQEKMLKNLSMSKVFLVPGHKAELFCLAAEEANELCIPTVTLGIGCLSERVKHGETGFVAKTNKEFGKFVLDIYKDENLWNELRKNLINRRGRYKWSDAAKEFISKI